MSVRLCASRCIRSLWPVVRVALVCTRRRPIPQTRGDGPPSHYPRSMITRHMTPSRHMGRMPRPKPERADGRASRTRRRHLSRQARQRGRDPVDTSTVNQIMPVITNLVDPTDVVCPMRRCRLMLSRPGSLFAP